MTTERTLEDIRTMLLHDGINFALVMKMKEAELRTADSIEDYSDYNAYMNRMARKYGI